MAASNAQSVPGVTRREFLFYVWTASIALYTVEFTGLMIWFAIPRIKEGEFGGLIEIFPTQFPEINGPPTNNSLGRFWLVTLDTDDPNERMYQAPDESNPIVGLAAIYKVCTHLGCIYAWDPSQERFACPCHGSKYRLDGRRIASPAPRNLDRFPIIATLASGDEVRSEEDGDGVIQPLEVDLSQVSTMRVDTAKAFEGVTETLLGELVP